MGLVVVMVATPSWFRMQKPQSAADKAITHSG